MIHRSKPSLWLTCIFTLIGMVPRQAKAAPTWAQECARPLSERNMFLYTRSTKERLVWMESVDKEHFEMMKRDGALIIPEVAAMSWSEFSSKRDKLRHELNVNYSFEETVGLLHWYGNPDANEKWLQCIKTVTDASVFDYFPTLGADDRHVILNLYWRPAVEIPGTSLLLKWDLRGGKAKILPPKLTPGEYSVILERGTDNEIVGVINGRVGTKSYTRSVAFRIPTGAPEREAKGSLQVRESVQRLASPDGPIQDAHSFVLSVSGPSNWHGASLAFDQSAYYEQAIVIWEGSNKVIRWGTNDWHRENLGGRLAPGHEYVLVAWNKPPGGSWRTSTLRGTPGESQLTIGVDDAPIGQGDGDFNDVFIHISY